MNREIILVEIINKDDMSTDKAKAFTKTEKADAYFATLLRQEFGVTNNDTILDALDNGFYDKENRSASTKVITLEDYFIE